MWKRKARGWSASREIELFEIWTYNVFGSEEFWLIFNFLKKWRVYLKRNMMSGVFYWDWKNLSRGWDKRKKKKRYKKDKTFDILLKFTSLDLIQSENEIILPKETVNVCKRKKLLQDSEYALSSVCVRERIICVSCAAGSFQRTRETRHEIYPIDLK